MGLPDPDALYPLVLPDGTPHKGLVHLARAIDHPGWEIGAYTYASSFDPPEDWAARLAPYLFPFSKDRIRIGRFCQIADRVRFVGASANHAMDGISTYPFPIHGGAGAFHPDTRDIVLGHDVWLGDGAMILAGARIGDGVVVGAGAVVRGHVPDYAVVTGNPATVLRMRFPPGDVARLKALCWWDWPRDLILRAIPLLAAQDIAGLEALAACQ